MKKDQDDIPPYNSGVSTPPSNINRSFKWCGIAVVVVVLVLALINSA